MKLSRFSKLSGWSLLLLSLTGCWSSHEIEELSINVGLAIDKAAKTAIEKELNKENGEYPKKDFITLTHQVINPKVAGLENKGGSQQKSYINISETGDSFHQLIREVSLRNDRPIIFHHTKVIIIGEKAARDIRLDQLLDLFFRDNEMRPSCQVFISKGKALNVLETKKPGDIPAIRILGIADNLYRTTRMIPPLSLAKIESQIHSGSSFLVQNIIGTDGEMEFSGAGVINGKTNKLKGFLSEEEVEGITWLSGKGKGGVVKIHDNKTGQIIIYEAKDMKSKITPHVVNGKITSFDVMIKTDGRISENWNKFNHIDENRYRKSTEKALEVEVKRLIKNTLGKMQGEFHVDAAGFGTQMRIKYPRVWEKVKKDWDQTFSEVPVHCKVELLISDYGGYKINKKF
jgi:spore germination protein